MNNMQEMITLVSKDWRVRSINGAVARLLGYDPELIRNESSMSYLHPDDRERVIERVQAIPTNASDDFDARLRTSDGAHYVCEFTVNSLLDDPAVNGYIVSGRLASALVQARERVDFLAIHDNHTGLLNRDGFMNATRAMTAGGGGLGILVIDIVNFRAINELHGEPVGDAVLAAVAGRIDKIRWPDLITARLGGNEFVMAVRSSSDASIPNQAPSHSMQSTCVVRRSNNSAQLLTKARFSRSSNPLSTFGERSQQLRHSFDGSIHSAAYLAWARSCRSPGWPGSREQSTTACWKWRCSSLVASTRQATETSKFTSMLIPRSSPRRRSAIHS